ncbi:hypothetical protein [Bianquea renquensis]|uniref:Uncharacterized protein n=1 Tax=Bianquea renquensis TaxID=2763661 RepID=A0A926I088_9FIRM|nr:hypothetical protein [Bianquea renquensis]MBC8542208.1 hypothetical protein [Bianquea renquensis]
MSDMMQGCGKDNSLLILLLLLSCCQGTGVGAGCANFDDLVFWLVLILILSGGFGCRY